MSDLVVVVYPSEARAEEIRKKLFELQTEYLIEVNDAVIATKTAEGHVKLNQLFSTTAAGAVSGGIWGMLLGAVFLMPVVGMAIGAASGAIGGALTDFGISDTFMKELTRSVEPGRAALFVLIRKMTTDKVVDAVRGTGGVVLRTSLDHSREAALRDALVGPLAPLTAPAPITAA